MTWEIALEPLLWTFLGSVRTLGMLATAPLFGHTALNARVRISLAVMLAWAIGPRLAPGVDWQAWSSLELGLAVGLEAVIGLFLGMSFRLIFSAFLVLGQFVATQGGLAAARNIDPATGASSVAMGTVFSTFALFVFMAIDGHHELMRAVAISFDVFPMGGRGPDPEAFMAVGSLASTLYEVAVRLAAPVTITIFLQNVAVGILGRAMPQLNLMMVQLPLHIGILLLIVGLGSGEFIEATRDVLEAWPHSVMNALVGQ